MKLTQLLMGIAITASVSFVSCKPKDADVQAAIETKLKAKPDMGNVSVDFKDGVATLSGVCKDDVCKADCEKIAAEEKGVKSVMNNLTIASIAPPAAPVTITADDPLTKSVVDATKDYPTVNATVNNGVITLTGEIKKASLPKLMMALNGLQPKKVENKLTIK